MSTSVTSGSTDADAGVCPRSVAGGPDEAVNGLARPQFSS